MRRLSLKIGEFGLRQGLDGGVAGRVLAMAILVVAAAWSIASEEGPLVSAGSVLALDDDAYLICKVREAVSRKLPPETIEIYVGMKATINTLIESDRLRVRFACISADDSRPPPALVWQKGAQFVYWVRPFKQVQPRVVGVVWDNKGVATIYFGVGFPR